MKLLYIKNFGWIVLVIFSILLASKIAKTQEIPRNNKITILNEQLQQAIDSGDRIRALKITDHLIKELKSYRSDLQENIDSRIPDDSQNKYPKTPITNRSRFGRELMLEQSLAYRDSHHVCVMGKIRNNSRSEIVNPVYVIADFMGEGNLYLGSRATRLNSEPIAANQTVSFTVFSSPNNSEIEKVQLRFQGVNQERNVSLYPTKYSPNPLSISKGNCQRMK